jgi:hypothetical protein
MAETPDPALADELETFRREWINEALSRRRNPPAPVPVPAPIPAPVQDEQPPVEELQALVIEEEPAKERVLKPVEIYELAVVSEREGRLNDGPLPLLPLPKRAH